MVLTVMLSKRVNDDIVLTAGQNNFFRYSFEGDISSASIQANAQAKKVYAVQE